MSRTAIVTGAASGIGLACARRLLADGWRVTGADVAPTPDALAAAAPPGAFQAVRCDVADAQQCRDAVARTVVAFGGLDALIHCAAVHCTKTWRELDGEAFDRVLSVNVTGSFHIAKAAAEHMAGHGGGAIVLTGSGSVNVSGVGGHGRGGPAYVTSKAAIIGLTRALARSLGPDGIRVNAISPGATETPMTADYSADALRRVGERTILGRIGQPEEIAAVAAFLVSADSAYLTGEIVNVSGGGSFG
ncbi:MAG: SDR family NAD(P)-dependent oxidoreductase [Rhodospirillales bacterium]